MIDNFIQRVACFDGYGDYLTLTWGAVYFDNYIYKGQDIHAMCMKILAKETNYSYR